MMPPIFGSTSRGNRRIRLLAALAGRTAALLIFGAVAAEVGLRVAFPYLPLLPFAVRDGFPQLPENDEFFVAFEGEAPVSYVTDKFGARVDPSRNSSSASVDYLVVGDSQAVGYGLPMQLTFGAIAAACSGLRHSALAAAPAADLEDYYQRVRRELLARDVPAAATLVVNLGNDLDEAYTSGQWIRGVNDGVAQVWLLRNSRAFQVAALMLQHRHLSEGSVPGVNRILYALKSDERVALVEAAAERVAETVRLFPSTVRTQVVLVPNDIHMSASELDKYERYFADPARWRTWSSRAREFAQQSRALYDFLLARLRQKGVQIVDAAALFREQDVTHVYSRSSHHLTTMGHKIVGNALCGHLRGVAHEAAE